MEVDAEDAASATTRDDEESEIASELGNIDIASADRAESANERLDLLVQFKLEELLEGPLRPTAALDAETWSNAANAVVAAFEELRQGAVQVVAEICDGERHTRGRAAKAQARWYQLKMATARKATTVALEQQAIRIAAQQDARSGEQEEVKKQLAEYKRRAARAEAKVKALEDEAGTTNDSLQNALELLDVTVGEKSTLVETVRELVLGCTAMRQERDDLQAEVLRMKAAGDPSTVMDDLKAARERIGELEGRHAEAQGELAGAHTRLEGMARVEVECKRCQDEIAECEQVLRDAFAQLNLKLAENEGLGEEVASLGEELGIKVEENMSLAEQLRELMNRGSDARAAEHARLQRLQAELDEMRAQAPQLDSLRAERRRLREELAQVEPKMCRLAELEASVEADATMRREHAEMSEILETMGSRYDVAETALERASAELKAANLRTLALEVASRQEREALVKAAVGSLQQLRTHLVDTLSGLREDPNRWPDQEHPKHRPKKSTEAGLDGFSWNPNKHRWGVSTAGGAFDEMVMRLEMPDIPPSSPSLSPELP